MNCAYDELYVSLAQRVLGDMYDFAVNTLQYPLKTFHDMFLACGMAQQFEVGNPTYIAGKNGCEVAREVIEACGLELPQREDLMYLDKTPEYWIGWSLAYYQWESGYHFSDIDSCVPIEEWYRLYPVFHEMDLSQLVEVIDERTKEYMVGSRLRRMRAYANMSQSMLAKTSQVPVRQIQLFEQRQRDIRKTQGDTLQKLSKALHCKMEDLL